MTTALDNLIHTDTLSDGDIAVERLDSVGGFLTGAYSEIFEVFGTQEVPCGRPFKVIGEGEDQYTERLG